MIYGIGVDVLDTKRIERTLAKYGDHFIQRLLMPQEQAQLARTKRRDRFVAMRFAAKEAIVKAMGTGFAHGIWIRDIGVEQNAWGKPDDMQAIATKGCGEDHPELAGRSFVLSGIESEGEYHNIRVRNYERPFAPRRTEIPIYLAAMGPAMTSTVGSEKPTARCASCSPGSPSSRRCRRW